MPRSKPFKVATIAFAISFAVLASIWILIHQPPSALQPQAFKPNAVLFDNVRVLSMAQDSQALPMPATPAELQAVLVIGNQIAEIGDAGSVSAPKGTLVVDGRGQILLPGLIDAHVHLNDETELAAYLAHGVTGLRNMSGYPFHLRLMERIAQQQIIAPDLITTGPIINSAGPNELVLQTTVTSAQEARAAVRKQHRAGYQAIKTYSNLNQQTFDALIEEATALNMAVTGHSPEGERTQGIPYQQPFTVPWQHSLGRGFNTLEHIETIVWHGLRDQLDPQIMQALAAQIALSGEAVTPTLYAHRRLVLIAQTQGDYLQRDGVEMINPLTTWFTRDAQQYWSHVDPSNYELPHAEFFLTATGLLHQAGVPLLTGTDSGSFGIIPGASVTRELELLVQAGLSPYQAIQSATQVNADVLGFTATGRVVPGYRANLILVPNDPLNDISVLEFPVGVMINGVWLDEHALDDLKASASGAKTMTFLRSLIRVIEMKLFA